MVEIDSIAWLDLPLRNSRNRATLLVYLSQIISKLSDSAAEAAETQTWLAFAMRCKYLDETLEQELKQNGLDIE